MPSESIQKYIDKRRATSGKTGTTTGTALAPSGMPKVLTDEEMNTLAPAPMSSSTGDFSEGTAPKKSGGLFSFLGNTAKNVIKNPMALWNPVGAIAGAAVKTPEAIEAGKNVAKTVAEPFVKAGVTGAAAVESTVRAVAGDLEGANKRLEEGYDVPGFGPVRPLRIGEDVSIAKDAQGNEVMKGGGFGRETAKTIGTGLEIGSWFGGGTAAANVGKQATKKFLTEAALTGGLGNLGVKLQEDDVNALEAAGAFVSGAAIGAGVGAATKVAPGAVKEGENIWRMLRTKVGMRGDEAATQGASKVASELADDASRIGQDAMTPAGMPGEVPAAPKMSTGKIDDADRVVNPNPNGVPIPTYRVKEAEKYGFSPRDLSIVDGADDETIREFRRQVQAAEELAKSPLAKNKPVNVGGEAVMKRVEHVQTVRKETGKRLNEVVKSMPKDPLDLTDVKDELVQALEEDGVRIMDDDEVLTDIFDQAMGDKKANKKTAGKLDFSNTRYANDSAGQKYITQLYEDLTSSEAKLTPERIRTIRQRIFDDLNLNQKQPIFSDRISTILKDTRTRLDDPLKALSPEYRDLAKKYAQSSEAIQDFFNLLGKKFTDADDELLSLRAGEVGNRLLGNASADTLRVLDQLEGVAKNLGFGGGADIARLFHFSDLLEQVYGIQAKRGFEGGVNRGVENALENAGIVKDVAKGNILAAGGKLVEKAFRISPEQRQAALKRLLGMMENAMKK